MIGEAAAEADGGDGFAGIDEEAAGGLDAEAFEILLRWQAVLAEEAALKGTGGHAGGAGHVGVGDGFAEAAGHEGDDDAEADVAALVDLGGIEHAGDAGGADDAALRIAHRPLGGEAPGGGVVKAADEFETALHGLSGEHGFISRAEVGGEMRGREVVIGFANHLAELVHAVVEEEGAIDPEVAAAGVFDPRLHIRQYVEEIAQSVDGGCVHGLDSSTLNHAGMKKAEPLVQLRFEEGREGWITDALP